MVRYAIKTAFSPFNTISFYFGIYDNISVVYIVLFNYKYNSNILRIYIGTTKRICLRKYKMIFLYMGIQYIKAKENRLGSLSNHIPKYLRMRIYRICFFKEPKDLLLWIISYLIYYNHFFLLLNYNMLVLSWYLSKRRQISELQLV